MIIVERGYKIIVLISPIIYKSSVSDKKCIMNVVSISGYFGFLIK